MSTLLEIEENKELLEEVPYYNRENIGEVMNEVVKRVHNMLNEKFSDSIVNAWYLDCINENGQVFFLIKRKSNTPLSLDRKADKIFVAIDETVGYESERRCGAMVYDFEENFLEKNSSTFMDFRYLLDNDAIFRII